MRTTGDSLELVIETELRPPESMPSILSSGGDGNWWDDQSGDHWGWSEDPIDEGAPHRRSRFVRVVALATVLVVTVGSVGAWTILLAVGPRKSIFEVSAVKIQFTGSGVDFTSNLTGLLTFEVSNLSSHAGVPVCQAAIESETKTLGSRRIRLQSMPGDSTQKVTVDVEANTAFVDQASVSGSVRCRTQSGSVP